jgi:hypothetical protein
MEFYIEQTEFITSPLKISYGMKIILALQSLGGRYMLLLFKGPGRKKEQGKKNKFSKGHNG